MREVAALYAGLATDGMIARLRLSESEPFPQRPFVEPAVARMVGDVLTQPFPGGGRPGIAWKTGTSWGGRDAWAVGFDAARVVAVWIGRPDGTPLPGATGRALAVPLLARLFDILPSAPRQPPPDAPRQRAASVTTAPGDLRLLFPPPGAVLSQGDIVIRAMGGRRPFAFLVDGEKLPAEPFGRETRWTPPSAGFYRLTVLDADGEAARSTVVGQVASLRVGFEKAADRLDETQRVLRMHAVPAIRHRYQRSVGSAPANRSAASAVRMFELAPRTTSTGRSNARASSNVTLSSGPLPCSSPSRRGVESHLLTNLPSARCSMLYFTVRSMCSRLRYGSYSRTLRTKCSRSSNSWLVRTKPEIAWRPLSEISGPTSTITSAPRRDGLLLVSTIALRPPIEWPMSSGRCNPSATMNASASSAIV